MTQDGLNQNFVDCEIIQSKLLGRDYHLLTLIAPEPFLFSSGQYVRMQFADAEGPFERYYSIANAPNPDHHIQFCLQTSDQRVMPILHSLRLGQSLKISEAAGRFRLVDDDRPVLLVAGGSGISPMRSFFFNLTKGMTAAPTKPVALVYGCRDGVAIPGKEEFLQYHANHAERFTMWLVAEANATPPVVKGRVTDVLPDAVTPEARAYVCGPPPMMAAVKECLSGLGMRKDDILQDPF